MAERQHNLPIQPTPLIGREREVRAASDLLLRHDVRLVTLTGPGGTGKTRVGLQVAARLADAFQDGVVFVGLASILDPALAIPTIAQAVGVRNAGSRPILETLKELLRDRHLLLALDNFEQILPAAPAISELLAACPGLKALVTSRAPLRLRGEREYPIPPLPLPAQAASDPRPAPDALLANPAITLFVQRATDVRPDFELTAENAPIVVEICRRLDGLPLAIELAAARVKLLPSQALLARLERRLPLLTGGPRDVPARQRTLRDTIAWSLDLLGETERRLFRRQGVFVGGCTLDAAEAVCNADGDLGLDLLDGIGTLLDNSLLKQEPGPGGEPRFTMLETIREYALERLAASGEDGAVHHRHLRWLADLAERSRDAVYGPGGVMWVEYLAIEHANIRAALAWSLTDLSEASVWAGLRLAGSCHVLWYFRDFLAEGRQWVRHMLEADTAQSRAARATGNEHVRPANRPSITAGAAPPAVRTSEHPRVRALVVLSNLSQQLGDLHEARDAATEALTLARVVGDVAGEADALSWLGVVARSSGDYERAIGLLQSSITVCRRTDDALGAWRALGQLGETRLRVGDRDGARPAVEESLTIARRIGHRFGEAQTLERLAMTEFPSGDLGRAASLLEECLTIYSEIGPRGRHSALLNLGQVALARDACRRATACFSESLTLCRRAGDRYNIARCLEGLACCLVHAQAPRSRVSAEGAARLLGGAAAVRREIDFVVAPMERPAVEQATATAHALLGDRAYAEAFAEGQASPLTHSIELGLALARQMLAAPSAAADSEQVAKRARIAADAPGRGTALTPREHEVAALIGKGYSNRRIAERLVIAEKTAEVHARNIREKLGLASRAQIAAWAAQRGLLGAQDA